MGGDPLYQNGSYIAPAKLRGKKYNEFVKRRDKKEDRKVYKKTMLKQG